MDNQKREKGMSEEQLDYGTFEATLERSRKLEEDLQKSPGRIRYSQGQAYRKASYRSSFRIIAEQVKLHRMGVPTFIVIADYQVLTDRDTFENISENIRQLAIDYMSAGIDATDEKTFIFPHSHVPNSTNCCFRF